MKLLVLADIHSCLDNIDYLDTAIGDCDGVVIAGDITDFGSGPQAAKILAGLEQFKKPLIAVPGNCDLKGVEDVLAQTNASVHGRCIAFNGFHFVGVGGSLRCSGKTPNEAGENAFRDVLEKGLSSAPAKDNLVLVSHQPAWGTRLDVAGSSRHTGSVALREFIEQYRPVLAVSGHMHEAYGTDKIEKTVLINPGPFRRGRYAVVEIQDGQVHTELLTL